MADLLMQHYGHCPDRGVGYDGVHGLGCGCVCICGPEACDDGGDPENGVEWCAYCAALDPSLPCPAATTNGRPS